MIKTLLFSFLITQFMTSAMARQPRAVRCNGEVLSNNYEVSDAHLYGVFEINKDNPVLATVIKSDTIKAKIIDIYGREAAKVTKYDLFVYDVVDREDAWETQTWGDAYLHGKDKFICSFPLGGH